MKIHCLFILPCLFFFICLKSTQAQDQQEGKQFLNLPFKEDSTQRFSNQFTRFSALGSIKDSKAEIEIRAYPIPMGRYFTPPLIYILGLYPDHASLTVYMLYDQDKRLNTSDAIPVGKFRNQVCYQLKNMKIDPETFNSILNKLVQNHLFELPNQKHVIDSLTHQQIKVYNFCHNKEIMRSSDCTENFNLVEIKLNKKFRNFKYSNQALFYPEYNPQIAIFENYARIHKIFEDLKKPFPNQ
jgi:hypothetical protein